MREAVEVDMDRPGSPGRRPEQNTSEVKSKMRDNKIKEEGYDHAAAAEAFEVWIKVEKYEPEELPPSPPTSTSPPSPPSSPESSPPPSEGQSFPVEPEVVLSEDTAKRREIRRRRRRIDLMDNVCERCERPFSNKANLARHQKKMCEKKPEVKLDCDVCHKVFRREYLLKSHLRSHDNYKPFQCDICHVYFKYKSTVDRHKYTHEEQKPYTCRVCGKAFTNPYLIKPHMRTHTKEKPYQCPICLKMFSLKHNMQRHALRHNKVKHLSCEVCHKQFPKESRLKYHMRVHWEDKKPFKCTQCSKSYSHKQNILRHYKKKHPNVEYIAPDTDAGLATKRWEEIMRKKNPVTDYIVPERADDGEDDVIARPELVMLESDVSESESSEQEGSE